jgi:hypothetical protein
MNLVIPVNIARMFLQNFGLRHLNAALGHFAIELAGPGLEWSKSCIYNHKHKLAEKCRNYLMITMKPNSRTAKTLAICEAEISRIPLSEPSTVPVYLLEAANASQLCGHFSRLLTRRA